MKAMTPKTMKIVIHLVCLVFVARWVAGKTEQFFPKVDMCGRKRYCLVEVDDPIIATCSIDQSGPSVKLQWLMKNRDEERKLEAQTQTTQHDNLNSTAAVTTAEVMEGNILDVLVCRAIREAPILEQADTMALLEANVKKLPEDIEDLLVENGKSALLDIKMPDIYAAVWKKLTIWSSEYETIAHYAFGESKTYNPDLFITNNGSLQIRKLSVDHDGNYICKYATPKEQGIRMFSLSTLILPSPPYPKITGCKQRNNCTFQIGVAGNLSCTLKGIRPFATLEWSYLGEGNSPIIFQEKSRSNAIKSLTTDAHDTSTFVIDPKNYLSSFNVSCRSVSEFEDMPQLSSMATLHLSPEALELIKEKYLLTMYIEVVAKAVLYSSPVWMLILFVACVRVYYNYFHWIYHRTREACLKCKKDTINKEPAENDSYNTIYIKDATTGELRAFKLVKETLEEEREPSEEEEEDTEEESTRADTTQTNEEPKNQEEGMNNGHVKADKENKEEEETVVVIEEEREPNDEQDTEEESTRADTTQTNEEPKNQEEGMNNGHVKKDKGNKEEEEIVVEIHASETDPMITDENTDGYEMKNLQA